jgi:hypothetical protein
MRRQTYGILGSSRGEGRVHVSDELRPGRDFANALTVCALAGGAIFSAASLAALEPATDSRPVDETMRSPRSGAWAPPAYLLPLGVGPRPWISPAGARLPKIPSHTKILPIDDDPVLLTAPRVTPAHEGLSRIQCTGRRR